MDTCSLSSRLCASQEELALKKLGQHLCAARQTFDAHKICLKKTAENAEVGDDPFRRHLVGWVLLKAKDNCYFRSSALQKLLISLNNPYHIIITGGRLPLPVPHFIHSRRKMHCSARCDQVHGRTGTVPLSTVSFYRTHLAVSGLTCEHRPEWLYQLQNRLDCGRNFTFYPSQIRQSCGEETLQYSFSAMNVYTSAAYDNCQVSIDTTIDDRI